MIGFIFLLILVGYAGLHYYLYRKLLASFAAARKYRILLTLALNLLIAAPFFTRYLDHDGYAALARMLNLPVFLWIAWLFWFFMAGIMMDLWNLAASRLTRPGHEPGHLAIKPGHQVKTLCVIITLATTWSLFEGNTPRIQTILVHHPAFPADRTIRLVQVSDVHLGMLRSKDWNRMICRTIASLKPDILVSTGDMVDTSMQNILDQTGAWAAITPPLGKFAVLGNHEYYLGLKDSLAFHQLAGFRLLRSETVEITDSLRIAGVDDKEGKRLGLPCNNDETHLLPGPRDNSHFSILMKHQPQLRDETKGVFNLQLSGHTHNGQLFPFHLFVRLFYPYTHGLYHITRDFDLYVSSGTGTWGPPLRLFAPPEITVFELAGKK